MKKQKNQKKLKLKKITITKLNNLKMTSIRGGSGPDTITIPTRTVSDTIF